MAESNWLKVTLSADGEMAESIAEVLARFAAGGVVIESTAIATAPSFPEGQPVGPLQVSGYLPVDEQLATTQQRLEEALWYLGRIRPFPAPKFQMVQQEDWAEAWKEHFRPIAIGTRIIIVPTWLEKPTTSRIPIRIDPGMAFGTGTHPTTQLCIELIETISCAGIDVIDVGCGSGILSIAAIKLGAQRALGVDTDPDAITISRENAEANNVTECLELGQGSLAETLAGEFGLRQAPLVLVNILAPVIIRLLNDGLGELLTPGGNLVLSGILEEQAADVEDAVQKNSLWLIERRQITDWVALWVTNEGS